MCYGIVKVCFSVCVCLRVVKADRVGLWGKESDCDCLVSRRKSLRVCVDMLYRLTNVFLYTVQTHISHSVFSSITDEKKLLIQNYSAWYFCASSASAHLEEPRVNLERQN